MDNNEDNVKKLAMDFLICCYFGQSKDLCKAAVDRAYVDMAAHTLHFIKKDNYKEKWECRLNASDAIIERIQKFDGEFLKWHSETIVMIKKYYDGKLENENGKKTLTEGQAQKWLNMTIKYLFVLKKLLGEEDGRLKTIKTFFKRTSEVDYRMPIDSYVLIKLGGSKSWSKLEDEYKSVDNESFLWELENWEELMLKHKRFDEETYHRYYDEKKKYK